MKTKDASWQVLYAEPTEDPDFSGAGSFTVDGSAPHSPRLAATIKSHHVKTAAGTIPLRLSLLSGGGVNSLTLNKGKVFATCFASNCSDGRINGAVTAEQIDTEFIPDLADSIAPIVARDCPNSPPGGPPQCQANSEGKTLEDLFDTNKDVVITTQEIRENELIKEFWDPDLDLEKANGKPGHDGEADALSFGIGFETVQAKLVGP
jgi:hypothetical protein